MAQRGVMGNKGRARVTFLPASLKDFLRRRAVELGGLALFAVAGALATALMSFNPCLLYTSPSPRD